MYQKRNEDLDILRLFLGGYNRQFYLREISRLTGIPLKTTQTKILHLEEGNILKSTISGKNKYFRLNLDNIQTKFCLLQAEINKTQSFIEKYPLFKIFINEIKTNTPLIVFGSFAKFKAGKDSDLDLLIISKEKQKLPFHLLAYKIHKIELSESDFLQSMEKQENLIKEIEENHIILNDHSSYVNAMWNYYGKRQT
ncbi:MAG: nucleotidyltransferase domain-containing protein [Nanoarchaeota archaeon]